MTVSLIVAVAENYGIGLKNSLPWGHIPQDMKWFKEHTAEKVVVMGSNTWHSLPRKPLPNRTNVVLTSRKGPGHIVEQGADMVMNMSPSDVIQACSTLWPDKDIVIIGGAKVYEDFFPLINKLYLTRVGQRVEADTYLDVDALMEKNSDDVVKFKLQSRQVFFEPHHITFEIWEK